jgi:hypothetical protein
MGRLARSLASALLLLALGCNSDGTSLLVGVALAPGTSELPEELRFFARQGSTSLYEDQRLPRSGKLVPTAPPELGTVVIELGGVQGSVDLDVYGLRGGVRRLYGHTRVDLRAGRQTDARLELWLMEPGPCTADRDCAAGSFCSDAGRCAPRRKAGDSCAADTLDAAGNHQCAAGSCADGHCCVEACGGCRACTGPGGTCAEVAAGVEHDQCTGGRSCDGRGGCRAASGQTCQTAGDCASGFCLDGVCCMTACGGACRRCGSGTCMAVIDAVDPRSCSGDRMCDGTGACLKVAGRTCGAGRDCASGFCVDGVCCNAACDSPCQSCRTGTCTLVVNTTDRECTGGKRCDSRGLCR